ncbi:MAG: RNA-binding protein [Clostridiales bacterium]|jgi:ribosomal protein L14E/L6E/L27E|nr:RNA-binding protein [Clostridiales bacterium]
MDGDYDFLGFAAQSKAGRDKKRYFIVVAVEPNYVFLADGETHKIAKPKKKKLKHVKILATQSESIREMLKNYPKRLLDSDIYKALKEMGLWR